MINGEQTVFGQNEVFSLYMFSRTEEIKKKAAGRLAPVKPTFDHNTSPE
jgi:hypothetical protein